MKPETLLLILAVALTGCEKEDLPWHYACTDEQAGRVQRDFALCNETRYPSNLCLTKARREHCPPVQEDTQ